MTIQDVLNLFAVAGVASFVLSITLNRNGDGSPKP